MSRGSSQSYDIAIVGGGLVGASLAVALEPLGYSVAVVEAVPLQAPAQPSYDDRTLALSHSSCRILQGLDLWSALADAATPIREVIVTELGRPGRVVLRAAETGLPAFGHVVEARAYGAAVLSRLERLAGVDLWCPARVVGAATDGERATVEVEAHDGLRKLEARLLIAADGAHSAVRNLLGIPAREHDYGQTAVICNLTPAEYHDGRAFERLTDTGPFAMLPHAGRRCGLVWSVETDAAPRLLELPEQQFLAEARQRFGGDLGAFLRCGKRSAYPLKLVRAERDVHQRLVLLGNAAHTIHPIGAQGFNLGLRDVAALAEVLANAAAGDPGQVQVLDAYADWRRPDQDRTVAWSDGMARLFANRSPAAALLRSAGLIAHALLPPLRRRLTAGAMGYRGGRTPRLALGERLQR
ncbi:MAG: 2-octaprenyl-6-methoxyphenyl hydroxylase [Xanthomonadales bacterium]|nr:2-octaprenyl-6-methoxyphenyl hydroxylase [Xanthomonadales bacterium]NIN59471.1 2-octaprenyl-6-methoxyphenyl hydroxylase [Xanthomonadales bacterium]NIN74845.1 2-octaprenyl-6-methoxyphenyl hydroxylase [Xanthomonadales bacterium]NIO14931.1 2-octaprenyl-6-methoxyphenyl hydroxylase [Xanthomonadales bacterium]NIP11864.1 2-octaprenyl-6-methoxyphenyl hydroxylase [Xanthomonadales bacterium]